MAFFLASPRLTARDSPAGQARFRVHGEGEPELESWETGTAQASRSARAFLRSTDIRCSVAGDVPFLYLDLRTPYGESLSEDQVLKAFREALGPRVEEFSLRGWHVAHLEDTHLGSNHRVFVSLGQVANESDSESWDQALPFEVAMEALADWWARKKRHTSFQLVLTRGQWVYSLAYRNAQPYHLIRVSQNPPAFAAQRLREHREFLRQGLGAESVPLVVDEADTRRKEWENALGEKAENFPLPPGYPVKPTPGLTIAHFGLALAAWREDLQVHNTLSLSRQIANHRFRQISRMLKASAMALTLGLTAFGAEGIRYFQARSELSAVRAQAAQYGDKVAAIQSLRNVRQGLLDSLLALRPLWNKPWPLDRILDEIARALPADGRLEGVSLRNGVEHGVEHGAENGAGVGVELNFRASVEDWNHIRPLQERLQKSPYFKAVVLSDQRKETEGKRVDFQAACILEASP